MWSIRCIYLLVLVLLLVSVSLAQDENGYEAFGLVPRSRYRLNDPQDWETALRTCQSDGGHLVVIDTVEEAVIVKRLFDRVPREDADFLYVGISDFDQKGNWMTIFGVPVPASGYNNWGFKEPNNASGGGEYCGTVDRNAAFNDFQCHRKAPFICERPPLANEHPIDEPPPISARAGRSAPINIA